MADFQTFSREVQNLLTDFAFPHGYHEVWWLEPLGFGLIRTRLSLVELEKIN